MDEDSKGLAGEDGRAQSAAPSEAGDAYTEPDEPEEPLRQELETVRAQMEVRRWRLSVSRAAPGSGMRVARFHPPVITPLLCLLPSSPARRPSLRRTRSCASYFRRLMTSRPPRGPRVRCVPHTRCR